MIFKILPILLKKLIVPDLSGKSILLKDNRMMQIKQTMATALGTGKFDFKLINKTLKIDPLKRAVKSVIFASQEI